MSNKSEPKKPKDMSAEVAKASDKVDQESLEITLSTGVVLKPKRVSTPLVLKVITSMRDRPEVPVDKDPVTGYEIPNPDSEAYIQAVEDWELEYSAALLDAFVLRGTEVVSVPKGMPKHDSDQFEEECEALNIKLKTHNDSHRYLTWFQTFAMDTDEDMEAVMEAVGRLSGTVEADVEAAENFPESD